MRCSGPHPIPHSGCSQRTGRTVDHSLTPLLLLPLPHEGGVIESFDENMTFMSSLSLCDAVKEKRLRLDMVVR